MTAAAGKDTAGNGDAASAGTGRRIRRRTDRMMLKENERLDSLLKHNRKIIQNEQEFCFSLDAVLLANFPAMGPKMRVLDLGTGTGVMPLIVCDKVKSVTGVEISPEMADMARRSVELNGLGDRITVIEGDYRRIEGLVGRESFDLVLSNPPYRPVGQGELNNLTGVARARHEVTATLRDTVRAARYALRFHGRLVMVHLPERLGEIIVALHENQLEIKRLQFVQPKAEKAPNMMLLEAVCGAAPGGLRVLPPLIVHQDGGGYTPEVLRFYEEEENE